MDAEMLEGTNEGKERVGGWKIVCQLRWKAGRDAERLEGTDG